MRAGGRKTTGYVNLTSMVQCHFKGRSRSPDEPSAIVNLRFTALGGPNNHGRGAFNRENRISVVAGEALLKDDGLFTGGFLA